MAFSDLPISIPIFGMVWNDSVMTHMIFLDIFATLSAIYTEGPTSKGLSIAGAITLSMMIFCQFVARFLP